MIEFVICIVVDLVTGTSQRRLAAAEAFETPPMTYQGKRLRRFALCLFMTASVLFLAAAVSHLCNPCGLLTEMLGFAAIGCIQMCVMCGLRYAAINHDSKSYEDQSRVLRA